MPKNKHFSRLFASSNYLSFALFGFFHFLVETHLQKTFTSVFSLNVTARAWLGGRGRALLLAAGGLLSSPAWAQVTVTSRQPARHAVAAARNAAVTIGFSQAIGAATAPNLRVYGSLLQGRRAGSVAGGGTAMLTFTPSVGFAPGEAVSVSVPPTLASTAGTAATRQVYQFAAATGGTGRGFFADTTIVGNTGNRDQVLGDVDGDGDLDLITTGSLYGCRIFLNNGAGHYTFKTGVVTAQTPSGVALADVDNDGDLDMLVGDADNASVAVCRNDGAGNFIGSATGAQNVMVGTRPVGVAAGDLDGDGDLDFATANAGSNTATVWFNTGGSPYLYTAATTVAMGAGPTALVLADIDNDGDLDLITSNGGTATNPLGEVHVSRNSGTGTFGAYTTVAVGLQPTELQLADIDGDGDLDLLTANAGAASVSVRLNGGSGTFTGTTTLALPAGSAPTGLRAGDLDADGDLDLLVAQGAGGRVFTYLNTAGTFAVQARPLRLSRGTTTPATAVGITLGDVDGDLDLDLITSDTQGQVMLSLNLNSLPVLPAPAITSLTPPAGPVGSNIAVAGTNLTDVTGVFFNGLAAPGFVLNGQGTGLGVTVPTGATSGPVTVVTDEAGTATSPAPFTVTVPVPVLLTNSTPTLNAPSGSRTGSITATFSVPVTAASAGGLRVFGSQRRGQRAGTLSGGGTNTLIFAPSQAFVPGEQVSLVLPASLQAADGNQVSKQVVQFTAAAGGTGQANFATPTTLSVPQDGKPVLGDLDNDGDLDMVAPGSVAGTVTTRLNDGAGNLSSAPALTISSFPVLGLTLGDVDGDGDLDLVATDYATLRIWLNNGAGTFSSGSSNGVNGGDDQVVLGDVDADGDLDVLAISNQSIIVRLNNGAGIFSGSYATSLSPFTGNYTPAGLTLGDVDADGDLDLVATGSVGNYGPYIVSVQFNTGAGSFSETQKITTLSNPTSLALGDLDGDGDLDLVVNCAARLAIRLNNGAGTFGGGGELTQSGAGPLLADVDADGDLDVVTHSGTGLNDGTAGFSTFLPTNSYSSYPEGIAVGDLDGDGDIDLLTAQENDVVTVRLNQPYPAPTLTVLSPRSGPVGSRVVLTGTNLVGTQAVAFNGVAAPSFVVNAAHEVVATVPAGATTGPVTVTTPAGTATSATPFEVVVPIPVLSVSPARNAKAAPRATLVVATFAQPISAASATTLQVHSPQRQGKRAGTVAGGGTSTLTFTPDQPFVPGEVVTVSLPATLKGTASGTAAMPHVHQFRAAAGGTGTGQFLRNGAADVPMSTYSVNLAVGDIDNDGDQDFIGTDNSLRLNNGNGTFSSATTNLLLRNTAYTLTLADLNADGQLDLLASNGEAFLNGGSGLFTALPKFAFPSTQGDIRQLAVGDLDGDGDVDVAFARTSTDTLTIRYNDGTGQFPNQQRLLVDSRPMGLATGDVDNDGDLDLVIACQGLGSNNSYLNVCLNNGTGRFARTGRLSSANGVGNTTVELVLGDLDGDGDLDLVTNNGLVRFNNGTGTFGGTQTTTVGQNITLGDIDADGDLDLLVNTGTLTIGLNNGQGQFGPGLGSDLTNIYHSLVLADLDGDNDLDLLASNANASTVRVRFNYRVAAPTVTSFSPTSGLVGATVVLTGTDFITTTSVAFNGTVAPGFVINSDTQLTVSVPAGATTGPLSVTNPLGTATSAAAFTVLQPVAVASVSPARNAIVPRTAPVVVGFSQPIPTNTAANLAVFSQQRGGLLAGTRQGAGTSTLTLTPAQPYVPGEQLSVSIPAYTDANQRRVLKQVYQFRAAVGGTGRGYLAAPATAPLATASSYFVLGDVNGDGSQDLVVRRELAVDVLLNNGTGTFGGSGSSSLATRHVPNSALVLGDFDGDGDLDMAVTRDSSKVSIRLNNGAGVFGSPLDVRVGGRPYTLALADMNADGTLDLVTGNFTGATCTTSVRFNDGAGNFSGTTDEFFSNQANTTFGTLLLGDLDADGDQDVAISNYNTILCQLNDGLGHLTVQSTNLPTLTGANSTALADVDNDGDLDIFALCTPSYSGGPSTMLLGINNGQGSFTPTTFTTRNGGAEMVVGDLDADNDLDILLTGTGNGPAELWLNNGQGNFAKLLDVSLGPDSRGLTLSDVDNDGDLDLLHTDFASLAYSVRLNGAAPAPVLTSFSPTSGPVGTTVVLTGSGFGGTTAVSFAGTAAPGFVVNSPTQITVSVPAGAATGVIVVATPAGLATSATAFTVLPQVMATSLVPGRNAVAVARTAPIQLSFGAAITAATAGNLRLFGNQLRGQRPGTLTGGGTATLSFAPNPAFAPGEQVSVSVPATLRTANGGVVRPQVYQFTAATGGTGQGLSWSNADKLIGNNSPVLATGDLDNDGDLDVLTATSSGFNNTIGVLLNNGLSQFQVGASLSPGTASGATYMALGDVDGDGDLDALVSSFNAGLLVYRNNGNATFAAGVQQSPIGYRFALGDLDADGDLDLVVTDYQRGVVGAALNTGSGTFVFQAFALASPTALNVVLGDLDNDGDLDAATHNEANGAQLFLNNGTGTLSLGATLTVPGSADGLALADTDADGDIDLAISYNDASAVGRLALFANNGSGLFARTGLAVAVGQRAGATLFGDVDHDGDLDLFTISQNTSSVAVRLNDGQGSFSGIQNVAVHADPMLLALGDFDGDGDLDFMSTLSSTGTTYLDVRLNGGTVLATTAAQPGLPSVEVYPNPAHGQFVVQVPAALRLAAATAPLRLYNAMGQLVLEQPLRLSAEGELTVSVAQLPPGIYTLHLALRTGNSTYKLAVY